MFRYASIPAVLRIDIEPDDHQSATNEGSWDGFVALAAIVDQLRQRLADQSGYAAHPTWMLRFDPDIGRCFGRPDDVVRRHVALFNRLIDCQDPLGIHVHAHRWDSEQGAAFSDYADSAWATLCVDSSADVFQTVFGKPVRRSSQGGYFLTEPILDVLIRRGIEVDLTVEPGLKAKSADLSFGTHATAPSTDFRVFPRRPYYPARGASDAPASSFSDARPILLLPLTSYDSYTALLPLSRRLVRKLKRRPRNHLPLSMWREWPSPKVYWDLVSQAAEDQPERYLAFAVRTDSPASEFHRRVRNILEYLPMHPIASRLRFVDPLSEEIRALAVPSPETRITALRGHC
jgi:hypothetical protein